MKRTEIWIFTGKLQTCHTLLLSKYCTCTRLGGGEENDHDKNNDDKEDKVVGSIPVTLVGNKTMRDVGSQLKLKLLTQ